ncbi:glycosyl hydrolase family 18 protein, partial [Photobacterium makurazakiensis]|uniref:glycoside hydrolase family 18 protein n=1 Tax=Photobacterium makurazakiensis TaxID=2910234 RepID=UPI003D0E4DAA
MNIGKLSFTAMAISIAMGAHAGSGAITLDYSTLPEQERGNVEIAFDMNWAKVPSEACYFVDEQKVGCQGRETFTLVDYDSWSDKATVFGEMQVPPGMVAEQSAITAKVTIKSTDFPNGESATRNVTLTNDTTPPSSSDFDYETSLEGMTQQTVIYNDEGDIKTGTMSTETVIERNSNKVVTGYVSEWAQYDRQFSLEAIDPTAYGKLVYSFLGICGDQGSTADKVAQACNELELDEHEIAVLDMYGGLQSGISQRQSNMGWNDLYDSTSKANYDGLNPGNVRGLIGQMLELKKQNPEMKLALSVGGWTLSEPFHRMAATPETRQVFVDSIVKFIKKWGFDGVDIDWEYPGHGGESGAKTPNDADNYVKLIQSMRTALDSEGLQDIEISSAVGATEEYMALIGADNYKTLAGASGILDYIYLMNYDYWGAFTPNKLGHQSNLYGNSYIGENGGNSAEKAINILKGYGVEPQRIMLGVANYYRGKQGEIQEPGMPGSATSVTATQVFGSHEPTVVEGYDLYANMAGENLKGENGFVLYTDQTVNADYYYNDQTGVYFSGDTLRTANQKARYAEENNLAGVFTWTVEQDHKGYTVNALNEGLGNTLSETYTTKEQRAEWNTTCGDNVSADECRVLNEGQRYTLGQTTENYAKSQPSQKSVFFYVPAQDGVIRADASTPARSVWNGNSGTSFIEVEVVNEEGEEFVAKIRGHKKFGSKNLRMNDGVQNGHGSFYSTFSYADNMHLPKGTYTAKQPVTIYGMSWSGAPDPVSKIQLDVNLDFNIEQDSIELGS